MLVLYYNDWCVVICVSFFFFKQKTAYEMRISDWSSDVCSSDLILFWRKGLAAFEQPNAVMTVDIMPTLASLIGLPVDASKIDGRCLDLISGPESSCR